MNEASLIVANLIGATPADTGLLSSQRTIAPAPAGFVKLLEYQFAGQSLPGVDSQVLAQVSGIPYFVAGQAGALLAATSSQDGQAVAVDAQALLAALQEALLEALGLIESPGSSSTGNALSLPANAGLWQATAAAVPVSVPSEAAGDQTTSAQGSGVEPGPLSLKLAGILQQLAALIGEKLSQLLGVPVSVSLDQLQTQPATTFKPLPWTQTPAEGQGGSVPTPDVLLSTVAVANGQAAQAAPLSIRWLLGALPTDGVRQPVASVPAGAVAAGTIVLPDGESLVVVITPVVGTSVPATPARSSPVATAPQALTPQAIVPVAGTAEASGITSSGTSVYDLQLIAGATRQAVLSARLTVDCTAASGSQPALPGPAPAAPQLLPAFFDAMPGQSLASALVAAQPDAVPSLPMASAGPAATPQAVQMPVGSVADLLQLPTAEVPLTAGAGLLTVEPVANAYQPFASVFASSDAAAAQASPLAQQLPLLAAELAGTAALPAGPNAGGKVATASTARAVQQIRAQLGTFPAIENSSQQGDLLEESALSREQSTAPRQSSVAQALNELLRSDGAWRSRVDRQATSAGAAHYADDLPEGEAIPGLPAQLMQFSGRTFDTRPYAGLQFRDAAGQLLNQVLDAQRAGDGVYRATLELHPPDLGRINVQILVRGENVSLQLAVASPLRKEQLKEGLSALQRSLEDAGLNVTELKVVTVDPDRRNGRQDNEARQEAGAEAATEEAPVSAAFFDDLVHASPG